ncbi:MAG TPA: hypothetical protein VFZ59_24630 [Verrucomicrobiae bacterium]|nr:hypothetical protein [Verrucomicrobiae bacterium]
MSSKILLLVATILADGMLSVGKAQVPPQAPPQPNPLMQLMLSQPPMDVTSPVTAAASFDPPAVRPGQKAIYRITLNALASNVRLPERIPAPPPLEVQPSVQGQILKPLGNSLQPFTSINYEVRANQAGMFLMPAFYVEANGRQVVVPAAGLEVATDVDASEVARQLVVQAERTNLYVGEQVTVQVLLPAVSNNVESVREIQINGDGLFVDKGAIRQTIGMIEWKGSQLPAYIYAATVTPISAGALKVSAQGFASGRDFGGPIVISGQVVIQGGTPQYVLLGSEPVTLNVRMLPPEGELPGFKGAIGQLSCDPPRLATNTVKIGEPLELWVAVRADVNLSRLVPPDPPRVKGWQSFPPINRGYVGANRGTNGGIILAYTLIPVSDELRSTPAIPFSAFDPKLGKFVDLTIPGVPITVLPDPTYTNSLAAIELVGSDRSPPKKLTLSGLVMRPGKTVASLEPLQAQGWFGLMQVLPVLLFGGLWWWDRRRQYLERHPEIVRRRRARRELRRVRRQLHRAARTGSVVDFTQLGVSALQIACAPHFPANPRALVCGDVLDLLEAEERHGPAGEIVRRFFRTADVKNFSNSAESDGKLLGLVQGLDAILAKLEARL